ncbi:DNA-binding protein [Streptomyces sp. NPDC093225]|uniref:nSTAND1 domain-containing NTPase n=1 Tax=Streptomyces sp. NPDC093225 TaxID=3366034 RepID=UPI003818642F
MGRQEKPLDPGDGPVAEFAVALRELRRAAGSPTYAAMARRAGAYSVATLSRAAAGDQLPTLPVVLAYAAACGGDPALWRGRWQRATDRLAALAAEQDDEPAPYLGLARYEPGDRELFFGRDQLVDDLVVLAREHRVVAVFGPSGSGKSSLLRAGLVPRLQESGGAAAAIRLLTPGAHPLERHRPAVAPADAPGDTWLIVDQFEEVFTLCRDPEERAGFVKELLTAAQADGSRVRVVLGVRADFYAPCLADPALAEVVRGASLPVTPMTRDELRRAIVAPAAARATVVERALTTLLVDELHGDAAALPLLSHTLLETWRRRTARRLTLEAYEAAGGVYGAVVRTAEAAYRALDAERAGTARRILLGLVNPGEDGLPDTRRPARLDELGPAEDVRPVLDALAASRLVTLGQDTVELAHETLISSWPRLHGWLEESREQLRLRHRLTAAAEAWDRLGRHPSALAPAALLVALAPLRAADGGARGFRPVEAEFLDASGRARSRAAVRRRIGRGALAVLTVAALIAGTLAWQAGLTAQVRRNLALALRAAAVAEGLRAGDPRTAARLNVAAWRLARTPQTRAGLYAALTDRTAADVTVGSGGSVVRSEFAGPDGRMLTVSRHQGVELWDLRAPTRLAVHALAGFVASPSSSSPRRLRPPDGGLFPGPEPSAWDWPERARPSPDGARVASISQGDATDPERRWARIRLLDLRTGSASSLVLRGAPAGTDLVWGGGSRVLAVALPGAVQLWDAVGRRPLFTVPAAEAFTGAAVSADGRRAALCGRHGVEVWDVPGRRRVAAGGLAARVPAHSCRSEVLRLSPDGARLAVGLDTGVLLASTGSGGARDRVLPTAAGVTGLAFNRDGTLLAAVGPDAARVWRTADERPDPLVFHQGLRRERPTDVRVDERAGVLRYVRADQRSVAVLRLGPLRGAPWPGKGSDQVHLSPDGSLAVVLRRNGATVVPEVYPGSAGAGGPVPEGTVPLRRLPALRAVDTGPVVAAFSPDGRLFAYGPARGGGDSQTVKVWDVRGGRPLPDLPVPTSPPAPGVSGRSALTALAPVLRDGGPVVYGILDVLGDVAALWNLSAHRVVSIESTGALPMAVRPDGGMLALSDGQLVTVPGERVETPTDLRGSAFFAAAFSPDGRHLALADAAGRVTLRDGTPPGSPTALDGGPYGTDVVPGGYSGAAFSPDGSMLAVGDATGAVRLWDVPSRTPLGGPLPGTGDPAARIAFTRDGATVLVQGPHTAPSAHRVGAGDVVAAVCARYGGGLDAAQWHAHLPELPYRATCSGPHD